MSKYRKSEQVLGTLLGVLFCVPLVVLVLGVFVSLRVGYGLALGLVGSYLVWSLTGGDWEQLRNIGLVVGGVGVLVNIKWSDLWKRDEANS